MTPRGYLNLNSYVKNLCFFVFAQTDGQTDGVINPVWASLTTILQVKMCTLLPLGRILDVC
jgi:hypothetical protein